MTETERQLHLVLAQLQRLVPHDAPPANDPTYEHWAKRIVDGVLEERSAAEGRLQDTERVRDEYHGRAERLREWLDREWANEREGGERRVIETARRMVQSARETGASMASFDLDPIGGREPTAQIRVIEGLLKIIDRHEDGER